MSGGNGGSRRAAPGFESMAQVLGGGGMAAGRMSSSASPVAPSSCGRFTPRGAGRPAGEVSLALLSAAAEAGPGTVRELAERACVGYAAARYTSSRLVSRGALVPLHEGRPMVLAAAGVRSFWEEAAAEAAADADDGDAMT